MAPVFYYPDFLNEGILTSSVHAGRYEHNIRTKKGEGLMIHVISTHLIQIIIGAVLAYFAAMIWYSPKALGSSWTKEQPHRKMPDDYKDGMKIGMVASALDVLLMAGLVALLWVAYGSEGILVLAATIFVGTFTGNIFKGGTTKLWMIDAGCLLVQLALITGALAYI